MCKHLVEDCPIVIEGRKPPAILVVFKMLGFDVILGMDWLSKHYASINFLRKGGDVQTTWRRGIQVRRFLSAGYPTASFSISGEEVYQGWWLCFLGLCRLKV
jgi:hypothetical protein